jgi:hypothetical protein
MYKLKKNNTCLFFSFPVPKGRKKTVLRTNYLMKIDKLILLPLGSGQPKSATFLPLGLGPTKSTKQKKNVFRTNRLMKIDKLILLPLGPGQTKSAIFLPLG